MAARKPTHAYVQYKDGDTAIVSVSLIKHYSPDDVTDLANNKLVCVKKNRKDHLSESYLRGDILTLGCGMDDLVTRILKQGRIVPEQVFEESCQGIRLKKSTLQDAKQIRHHSKVLKKPGKGKILGKRCREDLDSETDEEDELVPRRRLQEAEDEIAELEERLQVSRERLHEERQRNIKLQNLLEHKIDSMEASIIASIKLELRGTRPASQLFRHGVVTGHSVCFVDDTLDDDKTCVVRLSMEQNLQQVSTAGRNKQSGLFALNKDWDTSTSRKETTVAPDPPPSQPSRVLPSPREEQAHSQEGVAVSSPSIPNNKLFRQGTSAGHFVCFVEGTLDHDKASVVHWSSEQECSMARITSSSITGLQCMCPCNTHAPREGFLECDSRHKADEELGLTCNNAIAPGKMEKFLKADGKASLCHTASCLLFWDVEGHDNVLTNFSGNFSPVVCTLMKEFHSWLRILFWGMEHSNGSMETSCVLNYVSGCFALACAFRFTCVVSDLKKLAGPTGWVRDLCVDGDVENNPGPLSSPRTFEEMSGLSFADWVGDKKGQGIDMLSGARDDVSAKNVHPHAHPNVNTAVIMNEWWCPGPHGRMKRFGQGSWTTVLYPTSVRSSQQLLSVTDIRREDTQGKHVDSVPSQKLCSLVETASSKAQESSFPPAQFAPAKAPCKESPSFFTKGPAQQYALAQAQPALEGAGGVDHQNQQSLSPNPEVVVAAVGRSGEVLSSSTAMGQGVAFPLFDGGHYPFLHRPGTVAIVISKGVPHHGAQSGLTYACRIPITVTQKAIGGTAVVRLGGEIVPECDAVALRALHTKTSPAQMLDDDSRVSLVGEWFPREGNGTHAISCIRQWGPPCFVYSACFAVHEGTALTCTVGAKEKRHYYMERTVNALVLEFDKLSFYPPPSPTTCEASAFKLGLMLAWAEYGIPGAACSYNILTGQSQVHEPEVFIKRDTTIKRLFNSSGVPDEDCGGLIRPAFPFFHGWQRGQIRFFASVQCVPSGKPYLIMPRCFEMADSFAEAAVYLMSLLPWPWGNMSIVLETGVDGGPTPRKQMYTWYGATTVVPGELCLNVVLHQSPMRSSFDENAEPPNLALYPTMGPTAVEFWPPFSYIPFNFKPGHNHFVSASAFAASWALGYNVYTIKNVLAKIQANSLFDNVGRWVLEAPLFAMSHAGIMATQKAQSFSVPAEKGLVKPLPPTIPADIDGDDVPLMYRCWAAPGNRMSHIPKDAVWADITLPPDGLITLPNIRTLSAVNSGVWRFDEPFAGTSINVDDPLISAFQFIASERLFVGWHILHSAMGVATDSMQLGSSGKWPWRGETIHFYGLFGDGSGRIPRLGGLVQDVIAKAVNGPVLTTVTGVPFPFRLFPQRNWEPKVMDFTNAVRISKACPTPMTDNVVFKYSTSLPKEFLPFPSHTLCFNKDIYDEEEPLGAPPSFYYGPSIYAGGPLCKRVEEHEIPKVPPHSLWLNRLMHCESMYELRDYFTGDCVAGTPAPGEAPIEFPHGHDEWADKPSDLGMKTMPYPFFSTVWSSWMDFSTRHVLALLQRSRPTSMFSGVRFVFEGAP